ncbi:diaminopimelate epimerase [Lewinella sp. 4G2]|uniref:diaminopimelate epimerase n=1 Tax=Lewinella sp. 4G2 TaxID=1803372 RepID=UPI0007B49D84|nr:diaminopimelate epimerase [Lewinella sp. 4G2]OAV45399.1 diaminopimelate epimerase [Lewinella sp. 4G2]
MASFTFYKYHGAGNDFILFDDRSGNIHPQFDQPAIASLCHRRFGIGADGMIFLRTHTEHDFEMIYYNADGAPSSMCGNGGRCIVRFAADLGLVKNDCSFMAVDGVHHASLLDNGWVSLGMLPVATVSQDGEARILDTGSPHYVTFSEDPSSVDVVVKGRSIRNSATYCEEGINVNFLARTGPDQLTIATYERGVEDETLACGTGVTAAAIVAATDDEVTVGQAFRYSVRAKGGELAVRGQRSNEGFTDLWLEGPAVQVFRGTIEPTKVEVPK